MSNIEILIAFLMNVKGLFIGFALATGIGTLVSAIGSLVLANERPDAPERIFVRKAFKWLAPIFVACGLVACVPDVDDLWKVRVGLIKLELSSPENIKALVNPETIEKGKDLIGKIGNDVYCKYVPDSQLCKPPEKK